MLLIPLLNNIIITLPIWQKKVLPKLIILITVGSVLLSPSIALANFINASDLVKLTNKEREKHEIKKLNLNHKLTQTAREKAEDVLENNYFAHTTPQGKPFYGWLDESGYYYLYAGENLAIDFKKNENIIKAWMGSTDHRNNILNENYKDIGIAVLEGKWNGKETTVVVQMFGSLLKESPTVLGKKLEKLSLSLGAKDQSLKTAASNLVLLPSLAGVSYFDVLLTPNTAPNIKIDQRQSLKTMLLENQNCCIKENAIALAEEKNSDTKITPVSYPDINGLISNFKSSKFEFNEMPASIYNNLLIAGFTFLLLLAAYQSEIKQFMLTGKNNN